MEDRKADMDFVRKEYLRERNVLDMDEIKEK